MFATCLILALLPENIYRHLWHQVKPVLNNAARNGVFLLVTSHSFIDANEQSAWSLVASVIFHPGQLPPTLSILSWVSNALSKTSMHPYWPGSFHLLLLSSDHWIWLPTNHRVCVDWSLLSASKLIHISHKTIGRTIRDVIWLRAWFERP